TYPVIYVLDGNAWFGMTTTITQMLAFGKELSEMIVVGIGYPTDEIKEILVLREIDLTPSKVKTDSGGAEQFLEFLEKDVTPYVDITYRTKTSDRTLMGKSHGGLFALYALFHKPDLFKRYIVMSPTLWWDEGVIFEYEEAFAAQHAKLPVKLFLSVGEKEPEVNYRMVSNLKKLQAKLESRQYNGLDVTMIIMEDETHFSVTPGAISKGIITR
ncbi:MAG: alpha/beta hydrolase, partial [Planctomycetes bacterium]|nr:alpha/beta hydrolase [Planctomycetota bacterium]